MTNNAERRIRFEVVASATKKLIYSKALEGDQGFALNAISRVYWILDRRETLDELDIKFLLHVLHRVSISQQAINAVSGVVNKKGRASNGLKGMQIADAVFRCIRDGCSAEDAWERVAEEKHLSASMVKRHWMKWKKPLADQMIEMQVQLNHLLADGPPKV